jgi:WD40 repeat protein
VSMKHNPHNISPSLTTPPHQHLGRRPVLLGLTGLVTLGAIGLGCYALAHVTNQANTTLTARLFGLSPQSLHWLPDSRRLLVAGNGGQIQGWNTASSTLFLSLPQEPLRLMKPHTTDEFGLQTGGLVKLAPHGDALAIALPYRNVSTRESLSHLIICETRRVRNLLLDQIFFDQTFSEIADIAWSPDGTRLAAVVFQSSARTRILHLWKVSSHRLLAMQTLPESRDFWITWSADGTTLLALNRGGDRFTWNEALDQQQKITRYVKHGEVFQPLWAPDRKRAVVSLRANGEGEEGTTRNILAIDICDLQEPGKSQTVHVELPERVVQPFLVPICWSPDGKLLALGGKEGIYLIDTDGRVLFTYTGQEASSLDVSRAFRAIAWSPDGNSIATICDRARPDGNSYHVIRAADIQIWHPSFS